MLLWHLSFSGFCCFPAEIWGGSLWCSFNEEFYHCAVFSLPLLLALLGENKFDGNNTITCKSRSAWFMRFHVWASGIILCLPFQNSFYLGSISVHIFLFITINLSLTKTILGNSYLSDGQMLSQLSTSDHTNKVNGLLLILTEIILPMLYDARTGD